MIEKNDWRDATVILCKNIASDIRMIEFKVAGPQFQFSPGAHINIEVIIQGMPAIRSYTCLPSQPGHVRIAVKQHRNSRGGSRYIWSLTELRKVRLTAPENRFSLSWRAPSYLLMAGGIGITPIYGMAKALASKGADVRLAYAARRKSDLAFAGELSDLLGDNAAFFIAEDGNRMDIAAEIATLPPGGEMYICGPLSMLQEVRRLWADSGRPSSGLRFEVFGGSSEIAEKPFTVDILNHNAHVEVATNQSLLEALSAAGIDMIYDCQRGECGLCAVEVISSEGSIDHRDVFLSDAQKSEGKRMCACVSRFAGGTATIDLGYRTADQSR